VTRVLVIDDEEPILRALRINLTAHKYEVSTAADGASGLAAIARDRPDVVILDLGLPDMPGTEVISGVRGWSTMPIIVLSAWGQESQKVAALDAGADDYVTKPFGIGELLARLRVAVRRASPAPDEPVVVSHQGRRRRAAHADRVAAARGTGPAPRETGDPAAAASRRLGT
jgi:two-component system KDP operon response regulator KdpE